MVRYLIGALSGHQMAGRRADCLRTWMTDCELLNIPAVFLVGIENLAVPDLRGHTLLLPCPDAENTLSLRTRWFCEWALARDDWDYLVKCDDDTYISAIRLSSYQPTGEYVGSVMRPSQPIEEYFGTFCSGGAGYLISRRCAKIIAEQMTDINIAEDVIVGKLMSANGISPINEPRFVPFDARPAICNNLITSHHLSCDLFNQIHSEVGVKAMFNISSFVWERIGS